MTPSFLLMTLNNELGIISGDLTDDKIKALENLQLLAFHGALGILESKNISETNRSSEDFFNAYVQVLNSVGFLKVEQANEQDTTISQRHKIGLSDYIDQVLSARIPTKYSDLLAKILSEPEQSTDEKLVEIYQSWWLSVLKETTEEKTVFLFFIAYPSDGESINIALTRLTIDQVIKDWRFLFAKKHHEKLHINQQSIQYSFSMSNYKNYAKQIESKVQKFVRGVVIQSF